MMSSSPREAVATATVQRIFVQGNEALGWGAVYAGCRHFFGYPITPQNEVTEWFAREMPKWGGIFVQSEAEGGSINMVTGAAAAGVRAMTSTSSVGWCLMQEGMAHMANAELPCVVVDVQRSGPGQGGTQHAQMDYWQCTWGGGNGGYRNIVLAPHSVQETFELVQLGFYLADKYRNPVIILSDGLVGQVAEPLELQTLEYPPLPEKDWALKGRGKKGGKYHHMSNLNARPTYIGFLQHLDNKWKEMENNEVRYEATDLDDAELILVSYGSSARSCKGAMKMAREEGLKVGMVRPITVWPFPRQIIYDKAREGRRFLVVEDSMGQMVEDVKYSALGHGEIHLLGCWGRNEPTHGGMILPDRVLEEIKTILTGSPK